MKKEEKRKKGGEGKMAEINNFLKTSMGNFLYPYTQELATKGRYKEAEDILDPVLQHHPTPKHFILLGKIKAQQGQYEEAVVSLEKALELDPQNEEAKAAIKKVRDLLGGIPFARLIKWKVATSVLLLFLVLSLGVGIYLWGIYKNSSTDHHNLSIKFQELGSQFHQFKEEAGIRKEYRDVLDRYRQMVTNNQKNIEAKMNYYLTQIKGVAVVNFKLFVKQKDRHLQVHGQIPSEYLRRQMQREITGSDSVESADISGIEITHRYIVASQDRLIGIAGKMYGDYTKWKIIAKANKLKAPYQIQAGQRLVIP
jgi:nucleoid-associated protein YgaU